MAEDVLIDREGTQLIGQEWGSDSPAILLLHGLAGYAGEWAQTASWLEANHRVVALDARGHGRSERNPDDLSREAFVADVAYSIEQLDMGPSIVIGQSMGGVTALLLAAARPELVRGLVDVEAAPMAPDEAEIERVGRWLDGWPKPFPSRDAAVKFFGGPSLWADAWAGGLEERDGAFWPRFDEDVMLRTLRAAGGETYWEEWAKIQCPTLIVRGENGSLPMSDAARMLEALPHSRLEDVPGAGHDLHLEQPDQWRELVQRFVATL